MSVRLLSDLYPDASHAQSYLSGIVTGIVDSMIKYLDAKTHNVPMQSFSSSADVPFFVATLYFACIRFMTCHMEYSKYDVYGLNFLK